jgi:hypothetical protein
MNRFRLNLVLADTNNLGECNLLYMKLGFVFKLIALKNYEIQSTDLIEIYNLVW